MTFALMPNRQRRNQSRRYWSIVKSTSPKPYNIRALLELLDPMGSEISKEIWQAIDLTNYAVETRYPGPAEPVTRNEYRQALTVAGKVVKWAENIILPKQRK